MCSGRWRGDAAGAEPPHDEAGDGKDAGGEAAEAPEDFYGEAAEGAVVERGEGVGDAGPEAGFADVGGFFEPKFRS